MKNLDFRSVTIGILGSLLIFSLYGMRFQDENLGHIRVKSIVIEAGDKAAPFVIMDKNGGIGTVIGYTDDGSGFITTYASNGSELVDISSTEGNYGAILTYASDGGELVMIASTEGGGNGLISTYTNDGGKAVTIASTTSNDGAISIYNRHNK